LTTLFYTFKTNGPVSSVKLGQSQNAAIETILEEGYQQIMLQIASEFQGVGSLCLTEKKRE